MYSFSLIFKSLPYFLKKTLLRQPTFPVSRGNFFNSAIRIRSAADTKEEEEGRKEEEKRDIKLKSGRVGMAIVVVVVVVVAVMVGSGIGYYPTEWSSPQASKANCKVGGGSPGRLVGKLQFFLQKVRTFLQLISGIIIPNGACPSRYFLPHHYIKTHYKKGPHTLLLLLFSLRTNIRYCGTSPPPPSLLQLPSSWKFFTFFPAKGTEEPATNQPSTIPTKNERKEKKGRRKDGKKERRRWGGEERGDSGYFSYTVFECRIKKQKEGIKYPKIKIKNTHKIEYLRYCNLPCIHKYIQYIHPVTYGTSRSK